MPHSLERRLRHLFYLFRDDLDKRYIDVIIGLRRVGKTVLMYHLIDYSNPSNAFTMFICDHSPPLNSSISSALVGGCGKSFSEISFILRPLL